MCLFALQQATTVGIMTCPPPPTAPLPPLLPKPLCGASCGADACASALNRPLHALLHTVYTSCGVTVSWRLPLLSRVLTPARADGGVLRERCRGRDHVLAVVEDGGGASAARVAAVRLVQRADGAACLTQSRGRFGCSPPPPPGSRSQQQQPSPSSFLCAATLACSSSLRS
jgi:hypothetical protein